MQLGWTALVLMCFVAAGVWFWQDSLAAREAANDAASEACRRLALQLLDGTVAFAGLSLFRGATGRLGIRRTYVFDYTADSIERYQGLVVLAGRKVESIGYAAHDGSTIQKAAPPVPSHRDSEPADSPSNVLDLNRWRTLSQQRTESSRERASDRGDRQH
jgi:hypothetical protein